MKYFFFFLCLSTSPLYADTDPEVEPVPYIAPKVSNIFSLAWNSATSFSDTDFAGQNTARGGEFDFQTYLSHRLTLGFTFMWTRFSKKEGKKVYNRGTAAINAVTWRYLEVNPILVSLGFRDKLMNNDKLYWHLGIGTGGYSVYQRLDFGIYVASERKWCWGITPTAGMTYWVSSNTALAFNLKYNYVAYREFDFNNINMLVYSLGVSFAVN